MNKEIERWSKDSNRGGAMPLEKIEEELKKQEDKIKQSGKEHQRRWKIKVSKWTKIILARRAKEEQRRMDDGIF